MVRTFNKFIPTIICTAAALYSPLASADAADQAFLNMKYAQFKAQSLDVQKRMEEIENYAKTCMACPDSFKPQINQQLVAPSKKGRDSLAASTAKEGIAIAPLGNDIKVAENVDACASSFPAIVAAAKEKDATTIMSLVKMNEVSDELNYGLSQVSNPDDIKKLKMVLGMARPGNIFIFKKPDEAIAAYKKLMATHKEIRDYAAKQDTSLKAYITANEGKGKSCGSVNVASAQGNQ